MTNKPWMINQRSANGGKPYSVPPLPNQRSRWSPVGGCQSMEEQVEEQLRLKGRIMPSKWIKLTRPDDEPVWFSVDQIVSVEPALTDEGPSGSNTTIITTKNERFVKESVDEVEKML